MTQQHAPAGWYPDPTGRHESRYFDGQWTQHVSTRGVNSIDPSTFSPAPVAGAPGQTPYVPAAQGGPNMSPYIADAPSSSPRSPKVKLAIAAGAVAVAVGITLAVSLSGGGSDGHGFCTDGVAVERDSLSTTDFTNASQLSHAASQFDTLAAESPSPQDAADLRYLARWTRDAASGNGAEAEANQAQAVAAANRVDAYITHKCGGPGG